MNGKNTFRKVTRAQAMGHTLWRLRQRYGISASHHDYDVLVGRVKSAVEQLASQEGVHGFGTNMVFDVEFPGPVVRVAYNRIDGLIRTALSPNWHLETDVIAELSARDCAELVAVTEDDIADGAPIRDDPRECSYSLTLLGILLGPLPKSSKGAEAAITIVRENLEELRRERALVDQGIASNGVDPESWSPDRAAHRSVSPRTHGIWEMVRLCESRLAELERELGSLKERDQWYADKKRHIAETESQAPLALIFPDEVSVETPRFTRLAGDRKFGIYRVIHRGRYIGTCEKAAVHAGWMAWPRMVAGQQPVPRVGPLETRKLAAETLAQRLDALYSVQEISEPVLAPA